jgi:two-component SAPR family response regulator
MEPLITLSRLEAHVKSGEYEAGLEEYKRIVTPSPLEERWGGQCLWGLSRYEEAKVPLYRAAQRGEFGAAVDLIPIHVQLNEFVDAQNWIDIARQMHLSARDDVRASVFESELRLKLGQMRLAVRSLKGAWLKANFLENSTNLCAQIAQSLASVLHDLGQDVEALKYINKALQKTDGSWHLMLRITRAFAALSVGDTEQAKIDLLETEKESRESDFDEAYHLTVSGLFSLLESRIPEAINQFELALQHAERIDSRELQVLSRGLLSGAYLSVGTKDKARAVLMPLCSLDLAPAEEATRLMRMGQVHTVNGDFDNARIHLEGAVATFSTLEHQRELAWTLLRLAHLYLEMKNQKLACQTLERVSDIANSVKSTAFLGTELKFMGEEVVRELASIASPYAMHALTPMLEMKKETVIPLDSRPLIRRLRIVTLGKPQLLADDRNVSPRLNKAMELISYLSLHPQTSLERIVHDVFPDSDAKAGANYFHQLRHRITKDVPELRIVQDKQTKAYTLDTGTVPLESDYEDVIKLLNHATQNELHQALELYRGAFMPHLESEWAEEVRNNVEWLLVRSGLRVVQDLYERGDFEDCRKLTEKLRKVAPLDEGLSELLVRATNEIDGLLAARRTLSDVEKYFHNEVGELPPSLENLKREIKFNLN